MNIKTRFNNPIAIRSARTFVVFSGSRTPGKKTHRHFNSIKNWTTLQQPGNRQTIEFGMIH